MNKKSRMRLAILLVFAMIFTSFAGIETANKTVQAAVSSQGVITEGEGSFSTTLSNGEKAELTVTDCKLTVKVGSKSYPFRNGLTIVGMAVINVPDDLLHIFTLSGKYYCMDLRSGVVIEAYRNSKNGKYCLKTNSSGYEVFGSSIIDTSYFYEYVSANSVSRQRLITRGEFDQLVDNKDPSEDFVSPSTPTPTSSNNCGCANGGKCTCPSGQCKCENCGCGSDSDCKATPTPTATATPGNNCGCANGGKCTCPAGQCKCGNCNCGSNSDCKQTSTPQSPNDADVNDADVNVNGNGNNITVNQTVNNTTINGNGNSTGVNAKPVVKPAVKPVANKVVTTTKVKKKVTYYAIKSGNRLKLYKETTTLGKNGKIKTTRKWLSICLFNKKKGRMDWNSYRIKNVKKCQYSNKKHWIVIILKKGKVKACPIGKGTKKVKTIGKNARAFKCNSRGLATSYVKKNGTVVKLKY